MLSSTYNYVSKYFYNVDKFIGFVIGDGRRAKVDQIFLNYSIILKWML